LTVHTAIGCLSVAVIASFRPGKDQTIATEVEATRPGTFVAVVIIAVIAFLVALLFLEQVHPAMAVTTAGETAIRAAAVAIDGVAIIAGFKALSPRLKPCP